MIGWNTTVIEGDIADKDELYLSTDNQHYALLKTLNDNDFARACDKSKSNCVVQLSTEPFEGSYSATLRKVYGSRSAFYRCDLIRTVDAIPVCKTALLRWFGTVPSKLCFKMTMI